LPDLGDAIEAAIDLDHALRTLHPAFDPRAIAHPRLGVGALGLLEPVRSAIGPRQVVLRRGARRVHLPGAFELLDRLGVFVPYEVVGTDVYQRRRIARLFLDHFLIQLAGALPLAEPAMDVGDQLAHGIAVRD